MIQHKMLAIYPSPMDINIPMKIPSNANINDRNCHHYIVEYNSGKSDIYCQLYLPYLDQELRISIIIKGAKINVGNNPFKLFYHVTVFTSGNITLNVGYFLHI